MGFTCRYILSHQQDALTTIEGEALKNLALKKGSIQSRKLWGVVKGSWMGICRT